MKSTVVPWICVFFFLNAECSSNGAAPKSKSLEDSPPQHGLCSVPQNVAYLAGSNATLTCAACAPPPDSRIMWADAQGYIISDGQSIVTDHPLAARCGIISDDPTQFDLYITKTVMTDGAAYICQDVNFDRPVRYRGTLELVILDDNPKCTSTIPSEGILIEGEHHTISCSIGYRGKIVPSMTWTGPQPYTTNTNLGSDGVGVMNIVWSSVSFDVNRTMDEKVFECLTNFTSLGQVYEYAATNLPTYSHLYQSNPLDVNWGPKITHISPVKDYYKVGDVIRCFVDAQPSATVNWRNLRIFNIISGDAFGVDETFAGHTTEMRCQAQNVIGGFPFYDDLVISITVLNSPLCSLPLNEAVIAGSNTTLSCCAAAPPPVSRILWAEYATNAQGIILSDDRNILQAHPNAARYALINNDPVQFDLYIMNIVMLDGGTYDCFDSLTHPPERNRAGVELVILDDHPKCTSTIPSEGILIEGEHHTISCSIGYRGNIVPSMTWTGPQPYTTNTTLGSDGVMNIVLSSVSFDVNRTMDEKLFECLTNFTSLGLPPNEYGATNLPTYSHLYQSNPLDVNWGPKITHIFPVKYYYEVGDVIQCFVDAQPAAAVNWRNHRIFNIISGDTFRVDETFTGYTTEMRCLAQNFIEGLAFYDDLLISITVLNSPLCSLPLNEAVIAGSNTTLSCCAAAPPPVSRILWAEYATNAQGIILSDDRNILQAHPNAARYALINNHPVQFDLYIMNIVMLDGGTYDCFDLLTDPPEKYRAGVELVILDDHPKCTSTIPSEGILIEGEHHTIRCSIGYRGNIVPSMTWTGPQPYTTNTTLGSDGGVNIVLSSASFDVNRTMDENVFECLTNFTNLGFEPSDYAATNVPTYSHLYQSNLLDVYWAPKITHLSPIKDYYEVGDVIRCFVDAKPSAFIQWYNMRTLALTNGDTLVLDDTYMGHLSTMRCQAQSLIRGFLYTDILFFNVTVSTTTGYTTTSTITLPRTNETTTHPPMTSSSSTTETTAPTSMTSSPSTTETTTPTSMTSLPSTTETTAMISETTSRNEGSPNGSYLTTAEIVGIVIGTMCATVLLTAVGILLSTVVSRKFRKSSSEKDDRVEIAGDFETPYDFPNYVTDQIPKAT